MIMAYPYLREQKIMERMVEPERVIMFRVPWMDDQGEVQINRGFRVRHINTLDLLEGRMCIDLRRTQRSVTEQFLDGADIRAVV